MAQIKIKKFEHFYATLPSGPRPRPVALRVCVCCEILRLSVCRDDVPVLAVS